MDSPELQTALAALEQLTKDELHWLELWGLRRIKATAPMEHDHKETPDVTERIVEPNGRGT